jgi:hypothetical protein
MAQQDVSSADWVGRQFVQVYYQVLRKDPSVIHRFYKPTSQLTITDLTQSSPRSSIATGEQVWLAERKLEVLLASMVIWALLFPRDRRTSSSKWTRSLLGPKPSHSTLMLSIQHTGVWF